MFQCLLPTDGAGQPLRAAEAGDQAERRLGQAEPCRVGHEAERARECQFAPAPQREAVDGGNGRHRQRLEPVEHGLPLACQACRLVGREALEFADVRARHEGLGPGARDDEHAQGRVGRQRLETGAQRCQRRPVECVQLLGAGDGQDANRIGARQVQVRVGHGRKWGVGSRESATRSAGNGRSNHMAAPGGRGRIRRDQGRGNDERLRRSIAHAHAASRAIEAPVASATTSATSGVRPGTNAWWTSSDTP